jgi:hypothetical protein
MLTYWVSDSSNAQTILRASYVPQYGGSTSNSVIPQDCCLGGTLGSLVQQSGNYYALSNDHVLGRPSSETQNDAQVGEAIAEPGNFDFSCQLGNTVAKFFFAPTLSSGIDAALASLEAGEINTTGQIYNIGIPASGIAKAAVGMRIAKQGRTTGLTCGTVKAVHMTFNATIGKCGGDIAVKFPRQIFITDSTSTPFSLGGDSGSLIVSADTAQPVALLWANGTDSKKESISVGNPISTVAAKLGITFVGGATHRVGGCHFAGSEVLLSDQETEHAASIKDKYENQLMSDPAVVAVGIGAAPDDPRKAVIVVLVESRKSYRPIPKMLDGIPVSVILSEPMRSGEGKCEQQKQL